jgi:hypothetical protein
LSRELRDKDGKISDANKAAGKANEQAGLANERAAKLQLELARIDPVNLPVKSIKADIWLIARGDFADWPFENKNSSVFKGGASVVDLLIIGKESVLAILQCTEFESSPINTTRDQNAIDGRMFVMSFVWPKNDWTSGQEMLKLWLEKNNHSTAELDKELVALEIRLTPVKNAGQAVEITQSSCTLVINGSIQRKFTVPASSNALKIRCLPEKVSP